MVLLINNFVSIALCLDCEEWSRPKELVLPRYKAAEKIEAYILRSRHGSRKGKRRKQELDKLFGTVTQAEGS